MSSLIQKYNVPGPRYTSYPTVPYWNNETFSYKNWVSSFQQAFRASNTEEGVSIYIHLPFCESMCTFCGCHKRITKRHEVEDPYITAVLKEWKLYVDALKNTPRIKSIHLGGGTPTFFSVENLTRLIQGIFKYAVKAEEHLFSFEGHPNNTTKKHLQTLFNLGFTSVSFGVQDYAPVVQKAIHRIQPFEHVERVTRWAREIGYTSVGHDIIFGLPFQTGAHIYDTIEKTNLLKPDRIAFYSYAHVPWIKGNGQRGYNEANLPTAEEKRSFYENGKQLLSEAGYEEIGMDHFALKTDDLYKSLKNETLHRNFMGYTPLKTTLMIGLGVSSISDSWYGFAQNVKSIEEYYHLLENDVIPVYRGHLLNERELVLRKHILNLMCQFKTTWLDNMLYFEDLPTVLHQLIEMKQDGLLEFSIGGLRITEKGRPFVRNVCMAFDLLLQENKPETRIFSMTI